MTKRTNSNLTKLSTEQLISIVAEYDKCLRSVSNVLVDESKWNIDSKDAVNQIRNYLRKMKYSSLNDEHLGDLIDCDNGYISVAEYRKRIGFD